MHHLFKTRNTRTQSNKRASDLSPPKLAKKCPNFLLPPPDSATISCPRCHRRRAHSKTEPDRLFGSRRPDAQASRRLRRDVSPGRQCRSDNRPTDRNAELIFIYTSRANGILNTSHLVHGYGFSNSEISEVPRRVRRLTIAMTF